MHLVMQASVELNKQGFFVAEVLKVLRPPTICWRDAQQVVSNMRTHLSCFASFSRHDLPSKSASVR
ncbi:hypothetical protein B9Z47_12810 [Limnohabitans sp. 2KL-1]|jgi:hypothetical protein|uniref:hypothetical protein n=1 Tax=Limnohabitans sp. 2KL-1 TaxID=1100699 RepID=UPI000D35D124|nr:hypothetical protein [Limnohabitans sp. 2KL-1]PUE46698.1 hypothetical protein B9Z47_12810 [Limnohabitans sp. 2KL-1]